MFSTLPKINSNFSATFNLLSANAFPMDQSKNLSFGKELNDLASDRNENYLGKKENFSLFPKMFSKPLTKCHDYQTENLVSRSYTKFF